MKRLLPLTLAGAILLCPLSARPQVNAEQVMMIGRNVLSMEDYMLAIQYFNQAIKGKPYLSDPYFYRALAKLNLDDYKGAEADCSAAIERNRFKTEAYKLRGFARQQLGLDSLAIADYDIGLKTNPYDRYFLFYKGVAQTSSQKYEAADSTFSLLLKSHPQFDEGLAARGRLNLLRGDTIGALADADKAIRLNRTLLSPWLLKAQIAADKADWAQATEAMDEAILLRPEEPDFYVNRAYLRYNSDDFFGAMADYNYALQIRPDYTPALFNRALLRLEVKDLQRATEDFTRVLELDNGNFHALYNRGLVWLELGRYPQALQDFNAIATRYPRFYPVYYAIAESYRNMGNLRKTAENIQKADRLVANYVSNPSRNPLDRPAIARGQTGSDEEERKEKSPEEVMEEFNRLVTVAPTMEPEMAFNDRIKGRVQDRNVAVSPAAPFILSPIPPRQQLNTDANSFRELSEFNGAGYVSPLYLCEASLTLTDEEFSRLSELAATLEKKMTEGEARPADHLLRGTVLTVMKNYQEAITEFDRAIEGSPLFPLAWLGRAQVLAARGFAENNLELQLRALADLDKVLQANPGNPYAWFNKASIHYLQRDYAEARRCLDEAIRLAPGMGAAWFNRGLCLLQAGERREAFASLSKAGELGVIESYNLLKRLN
ncbi:MAG: tetratricopeptide repeat protein [Bacteroides sp.]|nr:tetratricopeptide repeat protein [Bacteroides sp.]